MRLQIPFLLLLLSIISCEPAANSTTSPERLANGPKNGEWITRRDDGTIKTRVNYLNGIKDGVSTLYHRDGKAIQLAMPYKNGKRHGTSQKYYENGQLYAETSYADDLLHGERATYYRNGKLKSRLSYHYGQPYADLKEYFKSGKMKEQPDLTHSRFGNTVRISIDANDCKTPEFFIGHLDNNRFPDINQLVFLPAKGNTAVIDLAIYTPSYLAVQEIICMCKSSQGNPLIVSKSVAL